MKRTCGERVTSVLFYTPGQGRKVRHWLSFSFPAFRLQQAIPVGKPAADPLTKVGEPLSADSQAACGQRPSFYYKLVQSRRKVSGHCLLQRKRLGSKHPLRALTWLLLGYQSDHRRILVSFIEMVTRPWPTPMPRRRLGFDCPRALATRWLEISSTPTADCSAMCCLHPADD